MILLNGMPLSLLGSIMRAKRVGYFDGGKSEWKKDADGKLVFGADGNPIWLNAEGKELAVSGDKITQLNGEAMGHRQRADAAETKLKAFEGIDAAAARAALDTVSKIDQKKLIDAGKVDEVRTEVEKNFSTKLTAAEERAMNAEKRFADTLMRSAFGSSKFIGDKLLLPADIVQATFGNRFKIDGDKIVGMKADGSGPIYSPTRAGEVATFDEALDTIVQEYPNRNSILKGANHSGGGGGGGGGSTNEGGKARYSRDEFNRLDPMKQASVAADIRAGKAVVAD